MAELIPISVTGFNKLHEELEKLEEEAKEVRVRVAEAREQGDLKENGEYIYGRQQLGLLEGKMGEIRGQINRSEKVDCTKVDCQKANFGTVVTIKDLDNGNTMTWQLLGPADADIDNDSISYLSPVGDAIFGLAKGEKGSANIPRGEMNFEVIDIQPGTEA